ncbi:MAG: hypothetical protein EXR71_11065 [Myxococcales bacterium]|nr:hypothetical protein [Myxococcales bacterium]
MPPALDTSPGAAVVPAHEGVIAKALAETGADTAPLDISTKAVAAERMEAISRVSAKYCNSLIVIIPIFQNPSQVFDGLMDEAKAVGGTAVIDVKLEGVNHVNAPLYVKMCFEPSGMAVKPHVEAPPPPPPPSGKKKK